MTERLADIDARIGGIRQLGAVVNAMRGIAAARVQQANTQLAAVDSYAAIIVAAIGRALILAASSRSSSPGARSPGSGDPRQPVRVALVLFCAEQGFAGAFSQRVLDATGEELGKSELFLIGTRGNTALLERGIKAGWTGAMPAHSPGIPKLADGSSKRSTRGSPPARSISSTLFSAAGNPARARRLSAATCFRSIRRPFRPQRIQTHRCSTWRQRSC